MDTYESVMAELEAMGTAQNVKIYRRHGASSSAIFGVSAKNMNVLKKRLKTNHDLAVQLWQSDNHDARILAMRIADPKRADSDTLERWVRELGDYIVTDAFTEYVSRTPFMREKMETWTQSDEEWISTAGWGLLAHMATKDETLDDDYFMGYLDIIRRDIHTRKNRTRYAMNTALICIGTRNDFLEEQAIAAAKAIGKVEVDHGETSCQTPDAVSYIPKSREHRRKKELKKA